MSNNIYTFQKNVTTSGTPVQLQTQEVEPGQKVLVKAKANNTGLITVGNSSATALNSDSSNFKLAAGQSVEMEVRNTNQVWIDATVNGEGVELIVGGSGGSSGGSGGTSDTELPSAAAAADATSNPTAPAVRSFLHGFNGTTWDRLRTAITTATSTFTGILNVFGLGKYNSSAPTLTDGQVIVDQLDLNGNKKVTLATLLAGEDLTNNRLMVEHQYTPSGLLTSDTQVKASAGFVHTVTFAPTDATPTAGTITIYNNTSATGTKIFEWSVAATAFIPFTVILDQVCSTGIFVDFTTTADVNVSVSYR
jgi:hypothetical protein